MNLFWTDEVHTPMNNTRSRDVSDVIDVIDKCNSWLADVTFDWRHVIVTAVERNNQTRRIITFLPRLLQDLNQNFTNNEQKRCENKA